MGCNGEWNAISAEWSIKKEQVPNSGFASIRCPRVRCHTGPEWH